jgi:hypothetical protein
MLHLQYDVTSAHAKVQHVFVYNKRTALSNGPTTIGPSPTFFHLKPKILFLKCCGIKKKRRRVSKTPIRLTSDTVKIQRLLNAPKW